MNPALGPFAIAALLLVIAGVLKALRPHDTAVALQMMRLPVSDTPVRAGGLAEALLGVAALVTVDAVIAALVAISYAGFCCFVVCALVRRLPIASCGCFGRVETPPSRLHVAIGLGACAAAIGMALDAAVSPLEVVTQHFPVSAAYVLLVVVGVFTSFALLAALPRSRALRASLT